MFSLLQGSPRSILIGAALSITLIALADWRVEGNIPLGFLYLFPVLLVGGVLSRLQIAAVAALCTFLTEAFDTFAWSPVAGIPRDLLIFSAFLGMGLFVYEVARNRKTEQQHLHQLENEIEARKEAEEQLKVLVESSPVGIFTADLDGRILLANDAAHRLFGVPSGTLPGSAVGEFLPSLATVPAPSRGQQLFRTVMQCRGRRLDGEVFLADVWFSTYRTGAGSRLAAMVVDTSEDLRTREELSLHQVLAGSRILIGAVSHEIRNVCGAIAVVHQNLARGGTLAGNKDFEILGTLVLSLEKIASLDLRQTMHQAASVDLHSLLEELRIVVEPALREEDVEVRWAIEPGLPSVWADRQSLMQVFLNLIKNSSQAMASREQRQLTVSAKSGNQRVEVGFQDTGGGVAKPERLFRPFQNEAKVTGLGLYLSRAFMRSFRGDLRYEPTPEGAKFVVELLT
jgi:PAS domain S-box-containing protein